LYLVTVIPVRIHVSEHWKKEPMARRYEAGCMDVATIVITSGLSLVYVPDATTSLVFISA
jgi:hypothetical protein